MEKSLEVTVRAMPLQGHEFRRRAGRAWGKQPVTVKVVENPKPHKLKADGSVEEYSNEISHEDYKELTEDQHIACFPVGDPNAGEVLEAQADIAERDKTIQKLRKELADLQEAQDLERKTASKELTDLGAKLQAAEAETEKLRASAAKKKG